MSWHWFIHWFHFIWASFSISPFRNVDFKLRFCSGASIWKGVSKFRGASVSNGLYGFFKKRNNLLLVISHTGASRKRGFRFFFFADCETKHALLMGQEGGNQQYVVSFTVILSRRVVNLCLRFRYTVEGWDQQRILVYCYLPPSSMLIG